jgi:hypothetical protein
MAVKLLRERHSWESHGGTSLGPWVACLPARVELPFLYFDNTALTAIQDAATMHEINVMKNMVLESYSVSLAVPPPPLPSDVPFYLSSAHKTLRHPMDA